MTDTLDATTLLPMLQAVRHATHAASGDLPDAWQRERVNNFLRWLDAKMQTWGAARPSLESTQADIASCQLLCREVFLMMHEVSQSVLSPAMPALMCRSSCEDDPLHFTPHRCLATPRANALYHAMDYALTLPWDVAEFGCYRGTTTQMMARLLQARAPEKWLHAFEGFHGLPHCTPEDLPRPLPDVQIVRWDGGSLAGKYAADVEEFWQTVGEAGRVVQLHAGWFADTLPAFDQPLCFAYVDPDLYESTKLALETCSRLIVPGGIVVIDDDQTHWQGVSQAVDEWLALGGWEADRLKERGACIARRLESSKP